MLTTMIVLCLAGAVPGQQKDKQTLYKSPDILVKQSFGVVGRAKVPRNYLMFNGTYLGDNYLPLAEAEDLSRYATTYYHREGPLGMALERFNWFPGPMNTYHADARLPCSLAGLGASNPFALLAAAWSEPPVAVLSMGAGTTASYARPFQPFHFFERDPQFVQLSYPALDKAPVLYYVLQAKLRGAHVKFFEGETRPTFEKSGGEKFYHLIQVETYKLASSTVLKELMTKEGVAMLMGKLADDGVLCFHTSNRYHDLGTTIASAAEELGLHSLEARDMHVPQRDTGRFTSTWVMVARRPEVLKELAKRTQPDLPLDHPERPLWVSDAVRDKQNVWRDGEANRFVKLDLARLMGKEEPRKKIVEPQPDERIFKGPNGIEVIARQEVVGDNLKEMNQLMYKQINIGTNFLKPAIPKDRERADTDWSRLATTYYHAHGPMGMAMQRYNWFDGPVNTYRADARLPCSVVGLGAAGAFAQVAALWTEPPIAVLGMGAGTLASYARPLQQLHFVERVADFVKLSLPKEGAALRFHYLADAQQRGATVSVFEGDHRETFAKNGAEKFYGVIVVETYKDSIRTIHKELMTKQGMTMLMDKLADDGVLCYHTTSRFYEMAPVIASVAESLGFFTLQGNDQWDEEKEKARYTSEWVIVARRAEILKAVAKHEPPGYDAWMRDRRGPYEPFWSKAAKAKASHVWTDAGANSFRGLHRSDPFIGDLQDWTSVLARTITRNTPIPPRFVVPPYNSIRQILRDVERGIVDFKNR